VVRVSDRADTDAADAKLERAEELLDEVDELREAIDSRLDRADELYAEAYALLEDTDE